MAKVLFSTIDRFETVASIDLANVNRPYQLPTTGGLLPSDRFIHSLLIAWRGRVTNAASGNPSAVLADAPFSLIDKIDVQGKHRIRKQNEDFLTVRGADLRELNRILRGRSPYQTPSSLSTSASATNDIDFRIEVPFTPLGLPLGYQVGYLLDAPNYDSLKATFNFADDKSIFSGQTSASTFSAFGGSTGDPSLIVKAKFAMWPNSTPMDGFVPGRVWRYLVGENTTGDIVAGKVGSRQFNLPTGNVLSYLLMKTGVLATGTSGANRAYSTLSDSIYSNLKVAVGLNNYVRLYDDYTDVKEDDANHFLVTPSTGFAMIHFAQNGAVWELFNATPLVNQANFFLQADVSGNANQGAALYAEEIRTRPTIPG